MRPTETETIDPRIQADPSFRRACDTICEQLASGDVARRLGARDHTLWRPEPNEIDNRLGWLEVVDWMLSRGEEVRTFSESCREAGIRDVVLLGMGGSSLAPEVFVRTFGSAPGFPRLHVLDSTSPAWVRRVEASLAGDRFQVLVASKSGSTIEVQTLLAHFWSRAEGFGGEPGRFFTAITDPDTPLEQLARERGFHHCFTNRSDIGGRYSALSLFGMVPAGLIGLDVGKLLERAQTMVEACRTATPATNPGVRLGAFLGTGLRQGRDKLTLITSSSIRSFGLWVEQLVAESTGKDGTGVVPVTEEPTVEAARYGADRLFVALRVAGEDDAVLDERVAQLVERGHPVAELRWPDTLAIGAEMYRWEYATAVAGHLLGVHPFDQPDVQAAKVRTSEVLTALEEGGELPMPATDDPADLLRQTKPGDYVAIMYYGDPSPAIEDAVATLRRALVETRGVATTFGVGPRFLHSTGQLHKGGPDSVVALQIVATEESLPVPGRFFGFDELMAAQAAGDLAALVDARRRVARLPAVPDAAFAIRALVGQLR